MAIIKCKMCGGDLNIIEGASTAECEFCGSIQTIPKVDDEKKLTLFARANRLRAACEFDKAAGIYESIVADFPEEAEAYWGLVLCKYGIEYVDDPGTGKKIPTCHRSSYDSVMDDGNFEQAMENADLVAQKVYREEAKTIERIRKGILEVSSKEQPYDIFICYKETDPSGDRTLDSVLAQDLYSALTDKGYRVFFSRITLQGKLGEAYEPYIFAALNSAKVMLAVGTCYEYYNAVWVKNEWSRYLKICEADKSKHLIPCYKNLDPEDMPKEFNHLQGADLGKMGAVQDILFNMEKYIHLKKQTTTVIQEKVVVGGAAGNKIASLLDRGNMALEDGDWAKADSFFEDVLNNDSKNAQAYLGKTLATEKCRTIDAFARKRKDATQNVRAEKKQIPPSTNHIGEIVVQYTIPGYVEAQSIRTLYDFDLSYASETAGRREQYRAEENYWANHKWLSKAEKFAAGEMAEHLQREKKALFAALSERVKQAETAEAAAKKKVEERYALHITHADLEAEKLYNDGLKRREADYQKLLQIAKTSSDVAELTETAKKFAALDNYQDSKNLAEHCRKRAAEEQAKINAEAERQRKIKEAEAERQRIQKEKQRKARQAKIKMISIISAAVVVIVVAAVLAITQVVVPSGNYNKAIALMESGNYEDAIVAFEAMNGYKDSDNKISECETAILDNKYQNAVALMDAGKYEEAIVIFQGINDHKDSDNKISECETAILDGKYQDAIALMDAGKYEEAIAVFETLEGYEDSTSKRDMCYYQYAEALLATGDRFGAAKSFGHIVDFQDAWTRCIELWTELADQETIGTHTNHALGLKADGTVVAVGESADGRCNVSDWQGVVGISVGASHSVGLKFDGTVIAVGDSADGRCNVSDWQDMIAISAGADHTVGLKFDGTVVAVGKNTYGQCDVSDWQDIVAITAGADHTVGLKSDGTVVAVGKNTYGQCDVSDWQNIVAISAGQAHTVGLKSDGTVVAMGENFTGQCNVSDWQDVVAISAGLFHTVGLKSDGSVVAVGSQDNGRCDVSEWQDIVAVSAGSYRTLGLKSNGTVLAVGTDKFDHWEWDMSDWTDIRVP